ncbi:restriction endonuclease subunit S [Nostoc sp. WHI]|uniref:restriction endonuclease subunit S n=1 Tax=Nostoc sp. WHI TaxID=2650611 RepID=UPI0018C4766D|nr:restriction endonuclease subunit S [Nostoc sp. WHI]
MDEIQMLPHWKIVKLGDMVRESIRDGVHQTPTYVNYGIPFIKGKDIFDNKVSFANCSYISLEEHLKISKKVKPELEDILLTKVGTVGNVAIIETSKNFSIFVQVALIKPKLNEVDSRFLMYVLHSRCGQEEIASKSSQSTMRFIGTQKIATIKIPLPPLPEQKTIAHNLRTIQKAKETRQRELELERERKAALMQYLFTHGTRNEPRKQTNIGKIPESWKIIKLGDLCSDGLGRIQTGPFGSQLHAYDYQPIGIPVVNPTHLRFNSISEENIPRISKEKADSLTKHYLLEGDILISRRGDLSRYSYISKQYSGWLCGTGCLLIRLNHPKVNNYFCSILFSTELIQTYLRLNAVGSIMPNLNTKILQSIPLKIPEIEEQKKIGEILHNCDRKIQALEKEITLIDELFHAMLEQLMTGKISTQPLTGAMRFC